MPQSVVTHLLASRPSGGTLASLFSDDAEMAGVMRRAEAARFKTIADFGRRIGSRVRDALLSQVPCEDITFASSVQASRRKTHM